MTESSKQALIWLQARLIFFLPLLCLFLYFPALHHDFVMDDKPLVVDNPYITSWQYLPQMLSKDAWNISDSGNYWRPVFSISLALDYFLWGLNPLGFHLTNILLHALNAVLLYSLGKRLQNTTCALFASLLFALHPIQAHAVNVISTRADLLAAFFTLLSLQAFFLRRTIPFAVACMLAILSKETSAIFPLALLSAWVIIEKRKQDWRLVLAFVILGLYLAVRLSLGFSFSLIPLIFSYEASWDTRLLLAFKVLALYFRAIFNLFEMPHPFWTVEMPTSVNDAYVMSGMAIFLFLLAAIWRAWKKEPMVAFGLAWFLIYFLPISNLKQLNQPMAEHWLYLPMIGLGLAFGAALNALFIRPGVRLVRLSIAACLAVFLVFGALVVRERTKIYRDDESFLLVGIRANPQLAKLYSILGNVYIGKQDIPTAKRFYTKALALDPNDFPANYMLGFLFHQAGQHDEAKVNLERIARIKPAFKVEFAPVAHAWEMLGNKEKALFYYRKGLALNPESTRLREKIAELEGLK